MKSKTRLYLFMLPLICMSCFTGTFLLAQTGDPVLDKQLNNEKTLSNNYLVFGYSYPTSNNKLVLNNGAISLNFTSAGWFKDDGSHTITNPNYIAGFCSNSFRNFFSFDLSGITEPITSAVLQIQKYTSVPATGYAVWQLFDVTSSFELINTDYSSALGNLSDGLVIYNDLGSGIPYGNDTIDGNLSTNTIITAVLNSSAIAALNATVGGSFIIGGKSDIYFPHLPPTATTASATNVQINNAILNGSVNPKGTQTSVSFKYGTVSGNLLSEAPASPGTLSGNSSVSVSASMIGLTANTAYYFQVKAVNTDLTTVYGDEKTFTTNFELIKPPAPVSPTPQSFCSSATIASLVAQPPLACEVLWYDAPIQGNLLSDSFELTSGVTYYAESFESGIGLSSLTRTAVTVIIYDAPIPTISGPDIGCLNSGISVFSTESGMTNYAWSVSTGGIIKCGGGIADNTVSVAWNAVGTQMIQVNYSDVTGCNANSPTMKDIEVHPLPVPTITGTSLVCEGADDITYKTEPGMNGYLWIVSAGGNITSGGNPTSDSVSVQWNIPGPQAISVVYNDTNGCTAASPTILNLTVEPLPIPTIAGNANVCPGTSGEFYTTQTGMMNYAWNVSSGGTIISGGTSISDITVVVWNNPGQQSISVNYTNGNGCRGSESTIYSVFVAQQIVPTITGNINICEGAVDVVYTTETGMINYEWSVSSGGTITSGEMTDSITVMWKSAGAQIVSIKYYDPSGCGIASSAFQPVTVNPLPVPQIMGLSRICINADYFSYETDPGMTNYNWSITEGGVIEFGAGSYHILVSWKDPGEQTLSLSYSSPDGCSPIEPAFLKIHVETFPDSAQIIAGNQEVCPGSIGIHYSTIPIMYAENYIWNLPEGALIMSGAGSNSIIVNFSSGASSGEITVYGENHCGAGILSHPLNVTVNQLPDDPGTISGPAAVCQGESEAIYSVPPISTAAAYIWTIPTGASIISGANTNSIKVLYSATSSSGNISVHGTNMCGEGNNSANYAVSVNEIPSTPEITISGDLLQSNVPEGNQWYFNGALIPGATRINYQATHNGRYWSVVIIGECHSDTSNNIAVFLTGTTEKEESVFQVYPIPNDGQFIVKLCDLDKSNLKIQVYNTLGIVVYEKNKIQWDENSAYFVDLGSISAGTYAVVLQNDKHHLVKKMLIK